MVADEDIAVPVEQHFSVDDAIVANMDGAVLVDGDWPQDAAVFPKGSKRFSIVPSGGDAPEARAVQQNSLDHVGVPSGRLRLATLFANLYKSIFTRRVSHIYVEPCFQMSTQKRLPKRLQRLNISYF